MYGIECSAICNQAKEIVRENGFEVRLFELINVIYRMSLPSSKEKSKRLNYLSIR